MMLIDLIIYFGYVQLFLLGKEAYQNIKEYEYDFKKIFNHLINCVKCSTFQFSLPFTLLIYNPFIGIGVSALLSLSSEIMDIYIQNKF